MGLKCLILDFLSGGDVRGAQATCRPVLRLLEAVGLGTSNLFRHSEDGASYIQGVDQSAQPLMSNELKEQTNGQQIISTRNVVSIRPSSTAKLLI